MCKQNILLNFVLFVVSIVGVVQCAPPELFEICKSDDSKCIKETTQKFLPIFVAGLPEYGVEVLDPLFIKIVNASQGDLSFTVRDLNVVGLKNCEAKKVYREKEKSKMFLVIQCTAVLDGDYELKGSVLKIPLGGKGKVHVHLKSALIEVDIDVIKKTGEDGKPHWHISKYQYNFDLKDKSEVFFENLNKDNEILGRASRELLENNGNAVIKEIGYPVMDAVVKRILKSANRLFKAMPEDKLSID